MADRPIRVQLSRKKGWKMPPNTVKTTRPGLYGNPFVHDEAFVAVEAYRRLCQGGTQSFEMGPGKLQFAKRFHPNTTHWAYAQWLREEGLPAIRGKNLACFCRLDQPCHADVLLDLANRPVCDDPAARSPEGGT